ncbi:MAG: hypothetical protein GXO81_04230 [Chlorobi bacterium]|nr:hypothetical protein [Chlorobiota bacterium]
MKKVTLLLFSGLALLFGSTSYAQESSGSWDTGMDLYSAYIFRGSQLSSGPALQPYFEYSTEGFAIGVWGSYSFSAEGLDTKTLIANHYMETDLYASYSFDFGLALTLTDYFYPPTQFFDGASHFFEPMATLELGSFTFTGAYIVGAKETGISDLYVEAALSAGPVDFTLGGGDGAYTVDGNFGICNIGIATSKEIKISDSFSLPVSGALILNPSSEQFHVVVGISL